MDKVDQEQLCLILESAILAPSADNFHRVRFQVTEDTIQIRYTGAAPPPGGYKQALAFLSLGAMSENLTVAASRFGIRAESLLFPDPTQPDWVVQIHLQSHQVVADPLWQAIPLRHTNRRVRFRGPKMTGAEQSELDAAAHTHPGCQLVWLDEPPLRKRALRLMRLAETERFHNRLLHEELFSAIRFDIGWRRTCEEGLPPGALGVEPPLRGLFALLRHWPVMHLANRIGAHHLLGWRSCDLPCRLAPHLGLLAVKNPDTASIFAAGRAFQRLWLMATRQGRVLQPMPASALYALEGAMDESISAGLHHTLVAGWQVCLGAVTPLMLFRMGRASQLPITAGRPPPEVILERGPACRE